MGKVVPQDTAITRVISVMSDRAIMSLPGKSRSKAQRSIPKEHQYFFQGIADLIINQLGRKGNEPCREISKKLFKL